MSKDISPAEGQSFEKGIPECPICASSKNVFLYGRQQYLVGEGRIPSIIYRCKMCDFNFRRFSRPMSEVLSHFKVAPYSVEETEQQWLKRREGFYRFLLDMLSKPTEGKSLLDIGCAFGHFLDCAVNRGYRAFGTEVSAEMAELLSQRRDYPVSTRSLNDLQLPEEKFDVIAFVDSLYYFEDPVDALTQCRKLLKPDGEVIIRVTNRNQMARMHRLFRTLTLRFGKVPEMPSWTTDDAITCHSRRSLKQLMKSTGFRITELTCIEHGKKIDSFGMRTFYGATSLLALLTFEGICVTPGIVCLAAPE